MNKDNGEEVAKIVDYAVDPVWGTGIIRGYVLHTRNGMYRACIDYSRSVVECFPTCIFEPYGDETNTLEEALRQIERSGLRHYATPIKTSRQHPQKTSLDNKIVDRNAITLIMKAHNKREQKE